MGKNIEIQHEDGIRCDNPKCDFVDNTVKMDDLEQWLNKPCPKCGENLLTEQDYINAVAVRETIKVINDLTEEDLEALNNHPMMKDIIGGLGLNETSQMEMTIGTHKNLNIKLQEIKKDKED